MKLRADVLLVAKGLCESRTRAQRLIQAGLVRLGPDRVIAKPSDLLPAEAELTVAEPCPYVSRGAYKLLAALAAFGVDVTGSVVLDVGASTGGFTDLLLQRGARRVYAVDVGHGQLHYRLRQDPRVVSLERVNARLLPPELVPEPVDVLAVDVSFISVRKVLPAAAARLRPGGWAFVLVKPQFEASRAEVGRGGVVRDAAAQARCVAAVCRFAVAELGWREVGVVEAPARDAAANREFMATFRSGGAPIAVRSEPATGAAPPCPSD